MPEPVASEVVNPDDLLAGVKRRSFLPVIIVSLAVHVVLVLGTSIGYMRLVRQHGTWHPRAEMKRLAKLEREAESEAKRKAAYEKFVADQAKAKAKEKDAGGPDLKGDTAKGEVPAALKATSPQRPKESSLKLDELE